MNMKTAILIGLVVLLAGCVTPQATKPLTAGVNLRQFRQVKLVVTDAVDTAYSNEGLPMFEGLLKGRLQSLGFTLVDASAEMVVDVKVHQFDPGNRSLRMLVGLSAGRAVFKYTARFQDSTGKLLAELEGGKAYHGMELDDNAIWKSDESMRMGLISYPVSQIGQFIENNGRVSK
jgi:hypothetical protein